jgi:hypothetical protein
MFFAVRKPTECRKERKEGTAASQMSDFHFGIWAKKILTFSSNSESAVRKVFIREDFYI